MIPLCGFVLCFIDAFRSNAAVLRQRVCRAAWPARPKMRFQIEVSTLDGKLVFHKEKAADAVDVAKGAKDSLGVTITDTSDGKTYKPERVRRAARKDR